MSLFTRAELEHFEREVARVAERGGDAAHRVRGKDRRFSREDWKLYADLGWLALAIPRTFDGMGGGLADQLTIFHAAGRGLLIEPLIPSLVIAPALLQHLARADQQQDLLTRIATGDLTFAFAHTPSGVGDVESSFRAEFDRLSGGYRLQGQKRAVLHAEDVDRLLVTATAESDRDVSVFLLDPKAPGVRLAGYQMIDGQRAADVTCNDALVPPGDHLTEGDASCALQDALLAAAIATAAEAVGAMEGLNALCLTHLKTRTQFGRPLGQFQVLQHRMVDMAMAAKQARAVVKHAAQARDQALSGWHSIASAAKATAAKAGRFVGEQAIQIHGGLGMTDEYAAGHYFKRLLLLGAQYGDSVYHLRRFADERQTQAPSTPSN